VEDQGQMRLLSKLFIDEEDKDRVVGQVHDSLGYAAH
jgi:hypothetical protein